MATQRLTDTVAGQIKVALELDSADRVTAVSIDSSRPANIGAIFKGKHPSQVMSLIPNLFLLCSQAQQTAAARALASECGSALTEQQLDYLAHGTALEWIKEHCWQLWQMGLELFGADFIRQEMVAANQLLQRELRQRRPLEINAQPDNSRFEEIRAAVQEVLAPFFAMPVQQFLTLEWAELEQWLHSDAPYARLLATMLLPSLPGFGAIVEWQPEAESGSLSRQMGHPLVAGAIDRWGSSLATRTLARMVEIAAVALDHRQARSPDNGQALASRGLLTHRVTLDDQEKVSHYRIDAPTDRAFSNDGLLVQSLLGQKLPGGDPEWARLLIRAIDPCVEFRLITHARRSELSDA